MYYILWEVCVIWQTSLSVQVKEISSVCLLTIFSKTQKQWTNYKENTNTPIVCMWKRYSLLVFKVSLAKQKTKTKYKSRKLGGWLFVYWSLKPKSKNISWSKINFAWSDSWKSITTGRGDTFMLTKHELKPTKKVITYLVECKRNCSSFIWTIH